MPVISLLWPFLRVTLRTPSPFSQAELAWFWSPIVGDRFRRPVSL